MVRKALLSSLVLRAAMAVMSSPEPAKRCLMGGAADRRQKDEARAISPLRGIPY